MNNRWQSPYISIRDWAEEINACFPILKTHAAPWDWPLFWNRPDTKKKRILKMQHYSSIVQGCSRHFSRAEITSSFAYFEFYISFN